MVPDLPYFPSTGNSHTIQVPLIVLRAAFELACLNLSQVAKASVQSLTCEVDALAHKIEDLKRRDAEAKQQVTHTLSRTHTYMCVCIIYIYILYLHCIYKIYLVKTRAGR